MIAAVTNQGKTRRMVIEEAFNSDKLIEFLQALIQDAGKKELLILDNLRVYHSKPVKAWVEARKDKIELFYLPSYSAEFYPEERLNADLKSALSYQGSRAHQGQAESGNNRAHAIIRKITRARPEILLGRTRKICNINQAGSITTLPT